MRILHQYFKWAKWRVCMVMMGRTSGSKTPVCEGRHHKVL